MKAKSYDTFKNADGDTVNRLELDIPGHTVQIVQYDEDPRVCVMFDADMVMLPVGQIDAYIAARLGGIR